MAKNDTILAVDIGADSLKMAEFSYPADGGVVLENFAFAEYGGDLKEEDLVSSLETAFQAALTENNFKSRKIHLSISGQSAFVRFVKLPPVGDDQNRIRQLVDYEARQNIPFPMDEVVWDFQLISGEEDGENEVMFVVVKSDIVENITRIAEGLGKEVGLVEVAPCSCYNAARANSIGEDECVMILNIGGKCSSLVFIDSGRFFVRPIPIAGHSITQQVSKEFGIPYNDAEEMKRRHGFVALGGAYEEPDSEVSATVSKIVRNVMTRLHGEINRSINVYRSQQKGKKPLKLYLAGGSSVMAFTPRFFSEKLRIPVEYFNPFQVVSLSSAIDRENLAEVAHMFSEVIGLGLRHATVCPIEISLIPESVKKQQELRSKIPYFYGSAVALVLCMVATFLGISQQAATLSKQINDAEGKVTETLHMQQNVKSAQKELEGIRNRYDIAKKVLDKRDRWIELFNEVQQLLPDRMWAVNIHATGASGRSEIAKPKEEVTTVFTIFGGRQKTKQQEVKSTKLEWLRIKGHTLCEKGFTTYLTQFKKNLVQSELFDAEKEEDVLDINYESEVGMNNFNDFEISVKLKKPIE